MLDTLQKLADITQKGVIAIALGVGGYIISRDQSNVVIKKSCDEMFSKILDYVSGNELTERGQNLVDYRLENYFQACGEMNTERVRYVKSSWKSSPAVQERPLQGVVADGAITPAVKALGWVATSRIPAQRFSDTNFDRIDVPGASNDVVGAVLEPRWQVNVRKTYTPVATTDNPVVDQVAPGICLKVLNIKTGTWNTWAEVAAATCTRPKA